MIYSFSRALSALIIRAACGLSVYGRQYIPKSGGFILASNHVSYLDPIALGVACPRHLGYMAKKELFGNPFFAWFLGKVGAFPLKRNSADIGAIKEAIQRLRNGVGLVIFPQGSRIFEGGPGEPQSGVGFLATKAEVPVIPAFLEGTDRALPRGAKFIRRCRVEVRFGEQIPIERGVSYQEISQRLMDAITKLKDQE